MPIDGFPDWEWPDDITEEEKRHFDRAARQNERDAYAVAAYNKVAKANMSESDYANLGGTPGTTPEEVQRYWDAYSVVDD